MDSCTQMALGAAVGGSAAGHKLGRRALLWGGLIALLPDLDLFIPFDDAVKTFTFHRSWSHSVFVMILATPALAWIIMRVHPQTKEHRRSWYGLVLLSLVTHTLLDCFTVYGTQILWPIPMAPVGWSTVFIIDPLYTILLLLGIAGFTFVYRKSSKAALRCNNLGLILSCLYLTWTVGAKLHVEGAAREQLDRQNIEYSQLLSIPTPFNSLLWRIVAMTPDGYAEGFYSVASTGPQPQFELYRSDQNLLTPLSDQWSVQQLQWFTRGFYAVSQVDSEVVLSDLRMGSEPSYVFQFAVGTIGPDSTTPLTPRRLTFAPDIGKQLQWTWHRIWTADVAEVH